MRILTSTQLTENGYTVDFETEILLAAAESHTAVANGAETYKNAAEMSAALDTEEDNA